MSREIRGRAAMFKLALGAGHRLDTPGKRCLKALDPNETREWVLNDRICDKAEVLLSGYDGVEVLRVDDTEGQDAIGLTQRVKAANEWGADFFLSIHHNSGVNGGAGGGIVAYVGPGVDQATKDWQKELYTALIDRTGLKGNRATPLATGDLYVLNATRMPAVLLELGFMDSSTDVPVILSEEYADRCAAAIVEVVAERGKLTKKEEVSNTTQDQFDAMMEDWLARVDKLTVSSWAKVAWDKATAMGVTDGTAPRAAASREAVITMLDRMGLLGK